MRPNDDMVNEKVKSGKKKNGIKGLRQTDLKID